MYYFIEPMTERDVEHIQKIDQVSFQTPWSANTYHRELRDTVNNRYIVVRPGATLPHPQRESAFCTQPPNSLLRMVYERLFRPVGVGGGGNGTGKENGHEAALLTSHPVVGYGGISAMVDEGHITIIAVAPSYRGQSIGELTLNGLIDLAFDLQVTLLTLEVRRSNVVAQGLYHKYGFCVAGERRRYYTDNREDALIMSSEPIQNQAFQERLKELRWQLFTRLLARAEQSAVAKEARAETARPGQQQW